MKHVEFLIWCHRENKANSKSFVSKELGCNKKQQALLLLYVVSQHCASGPEWIWSFSPRQKMFESLDFGYYMIAVFSSKGIILRGIQM